MKKTKLYLGLFAVLSMALILVGCSGSASEAYVTVDFNSSTTQTVSYTSILNSSVVNLSTDTTDTTDTTLPSIELIVNNNNTVVYVNALNTEAEVLLANITVVGLNVDDAMSLIIDEAITLGYIDTTADQTIVTVSSASDSSLGAKVRERIKAAINNAFLYQGIMGKAADKVFSTDFIAEADSYGVTPEFLFLAYSVTYVDDTITLDDALTMTQDELVTILQDAKDAAKTVAQTYKEEFLAAREEIRNTYQPQIADLESQIATLESQIANATTDTTDLEAQLTQLQTQLQTVIAERNAALVQLREEYQAKTQAMLEEYQALAEARQSMYSEKVQAWNQNRINRMNQWQEAIKNYQSDDSTDSTD